MSSRFVVRSAQPPKQGTNLLTNWLVPIAPAAAAAVVCRYQSSDLIDAFFLPYDVVVIVAIVVSATMLLFGVSAAVWLAGRHIYYRVEVEITPLGVQISTFGEASPARLSWRKGGRSMTKNKVGGGMVGVPTFISRDSVIDAVVSEVVLSYKVSSVVVFRVHDETVLTNDRALKSDANVATMMAAGAVRLVPAFPGMEMSHVQCLKMWEGIMIALGKFGDDYQCCEDMEGHQKRSSNRREQNSFT
uniref:GPI-GlcNAc transferase complex PIG-H component conserved domain-containing protein n=1 Tax=Pseudictyota dubia TaxID=2749911 RepID=A0A7R9WGT2_9STRA|mmetsp:Transcript_47478/g.88148  ORF Transcript_47478/g.88148 Transcript_47478/m.88148 type:complete len:245 (+) Transcript_47478:23-757(+)